MANGNGVWGFTQNNPYPQSQFLDETTKRPTRAWQQFFLNLFSFTSSFSASAGNAELPSNPVGFVDVIVDGKNYKLPYYGE
jgi:hypothetical protein